MGTEGGSNDQQAQSYRGEGGIAESYSRSDEDGNDCRGTKTNTFTTSVTEAEAGSQILECKARLIYRVRLLKKKRKGRGKWH